MNNLFNFLFYNLIKLKIPLIFGKVLLLKLKHKKNIKNSKLRLLLLFFMLSMFLWVLLHNKKETQ